MVLRKIGKLKKSRQDLQFLVNLQLFCDILERIRKPKGCFPRGKIINCLLLKKINYLLNMYASQGTYVPSAHLEGGVPAATDYAVNQGISDFHITHNAFGFPHKILHKLLSSILKCI